MTNIYLMKDEPTGLYKLGHSGNPQKREATLLAQAPKVTLICYWPNKPNQMEKWLHQRYEKQRQRGEWFALTDRDLLDLYCIPVVNSPQRIDVMPLEPDFARVVMHKVCRFALLAKKYNDPGAEWVKNISPKWMQQYTASAAYQSV